MSPCCYLYPLFPFQESVSAPLQSHLNCFAYDYDQHGSWLTEIRITYCSFPKVLVLGTLQVFFL